MKLAQGVLLCSLITSAFISFGQNSVGIGVANPNKNAVLELISPGSNQGVLIPKLTTAQRTATTFTGGLTTKENGLLVFDSSDSKFYYWDATQWKELGSAALTSGNGITIVNNTVSTVPQDLEVVGSTLTITNNPTAVPINLSALDIPQDLQLIGSTLKITNNPLATPINLSAFSGVDTDDQLLTFNTGTSDLSLTKLTGGPQTVNLATVNTDDQTLSYVPGTGVLSITRKTGGSQTATITTAGAAGGDLTGTYPNPTVTANAITSAKILDATVASIDITDGTVASIDIADNSVSTADILDNTVASIDITDNGVASVDIADNSVASIDITDNTVASVDIADNSVASIDITDGTVSTTDILDATVALVDLAPNSVNSSKIVDLSIIDGDIAASAGINVSKLSVGTSGDVLTTSGTTAAWTTPSGFTTLINSAGTRNLFAGNPVGSPSGLAPNSDNTFYGWSAGGTNMTGSWNVAMGSQAGQNNVVGTLNVLIGWRAGFGAASATYNGNTFIGAQAGQVATGGPNTFIGEKAGLATSTGTQNVFVGNATGSVNVNGAQNTLIGYNADVSTAGLLNATALGFATIVDASNKVRIGNNAVTVIQGQVAFTNVSDRRFKTNIMPIADGLDLILKLKPVSYNMKNSSDARTNWGFIAQDVESLVGETNAVLTIGADKDRMLGLRYTDFVAPLVKAVQEQQDQIADLNTRLNESEKKYDALAAELEKIRKAVGLKADIK